MTGTRSRKASNGRFGIRDRDERVRRGVDQDRVAVGISARDRCHRDGIPGAYAILDDDRLTELPRELLEHGTRNDVQRASWTLRDDGVDGPRWPFLAEGDADLKKQQKHRRRQSTRHLVSFPDSKPGLPHESGGAAVQGSGLPIFVRKARKTASGVSGNSVSRTPTASSMAFAIAGERQRVADLPAPFAPNGPLC